MNTQILRPQVASAQPPSDPNSEPNALLQMPLAPEPELGLSTETAPPEREAVRVLVIGSRPSVTTIVQTLHRLGFAEAGEWSPFLPGPNPGEVMRILMRYILKS